MTASESWVRRNLFLPILSYLYVLDLGMLTVEVGCVFGTSNIGFQNIPRILGQVDLSSGWLLYLWALREGRFGTEPKMAEVKRFSCTALFLSEWLRTKIPMKTQETKNVLDTWQLGPPAVSRLRTKNTKRKWKTSRLGASSFIFWCLT